MENDSDGLKVHLTYKNETESATYMFKVADDESYDIMVRYEIKTGNELVEYGHAKIYIHTDEVTGETSYTYELVGNRGGHEHHYDDEIDRGHKHGEDHKGR